MNLSQMYEYRKKNSKVTTYYVHIPYTVLSGYRSIFFINEQDDTNKIKFFMIRKKFDNIYDSSFLKI